MDSIRNILTVQIRPMRESDIPQVLAIEEDIFQGGWDEDTFRDCVHKPLYGAVVAVSPNEFGRKRIVGYAVYEIKKPELHLINFVVARNYWRCRIGRQMIKRLADKLAEKSCYQVIVDIRETYLHVQLFFKAMGFLAIDILHGACEDTRDDAYRMRYLLPGHQDLENPFAPYNRISNYFANKTA